MRQLIYSFLGFLIISGNVMAGENYCHGSFEDRTYVVPTFNHKFCFATPEFMKTFASHLYDNKIPFVVYEYGHIGYKTEHKGKVQKIGDALVAEYLKKKGQ